MSSFLRNLLRVKDWFMGSWLGIPLQVIPGRVGGELWRREEKKLGADAVSTKTSVTLGELWARGGSSEVALLWVEEPGSHECIIRGRWSLPWNSEPGPGSFPQLTAAQRALTGEAGCAPPCLRGIWAAQQGPGRNVPDPITKLALS